jgi:hypothetical protein
MRHRQLAGGVTVLADTDLLPLYAATPQGWRAEQDGLVREPGDVTDCPPWLLQELGARWVAVAG